MNTTSSSRRIGVALIGAGMIAQTHIEALSAAKSGLQLKAILSRTPDMARYLNAYYDGPSPVFTSDLAQITNDPTIDFVIVATPPSVRIDLITTLAQAGKHILLEKPVARTLAEAKEVVQICQTAGVTLGVLFQFRKRAPSLMAHRILAKGRLGRLGHVEISVPLWRSQAYYDELGRGTYARDGGGVLLTQAIHTLDLALSFTGPVASVQAMTATTPLHDMEAEDFAAAGLRFANGAVGSLTASTATYPHGLESLTLHYEHGSMRIDKDRLDLHWRNGAVEHFPPPGYAKPEKHEWHQAVIEDFAKAIATGTPPMVSGTAALGVHHLIDAIETSSRLGQVVTCPV